MTWPNCVRRTRYPGMEKPMTWALMGCVNLSYLILFVKKNRVRHGVTCVFSFLYLLALFPVAYAFEPGEPMKLNHVLHIDEDVRGDFKITPDNKVVVYTSRLEQGEVELFFVPVDGGVARKLTASHDGDVVGFKISPDSRHIVYRVNDGLVPELWLVDIPSTPTQIIRNRMLTGSVTDHPTEITTYLISSDSSHVVYLASTPSSIPRRLYSSSLIEPFSNSPIKLGGSGFGNDQDIAPKFQFVPGANRVVFRGRLIELGKIELFVTSSNTSSTPTKLNINLVDGRDVSSSFSISPDGKFVVYIADARINGLNELYSTNLSFPQIFRKLNRDTFGSVQRFAISPDSRRVVYRSNERIAVGVDDELFSVPINGSGAQRIRISGDLEPGSDVSLFSISPNSEKVAYLAGPSNGRAELFSTLISDQLVTSLTPNLGADKFILDIDFNNAGSRVVYLADGAGPAAIFSVGVNGGGTEPLMPPLVSGQSLGQSLVNRNLDRVFYLSDQRNRDVIELFSTDLEGPLTSNVRLNTPFPVGSLKDVKRFRISSDGKFLVYRADQDNNEQFELYSVNLDVGSTCFPIKASNGNVAVFCL